MRRTSSFHTRGKALRRGHMPGLAWIALAALLSLVFTSVQDALAQAPENPNTNNVVAVDDCNPPNSWKCIIVDGPPLFTNMTDRSMRFDSNGVPHIVYGGDHLYYSVYDPVAKVWNTTTLDNSPQVGQYASLALDKNNNPRISYYDALNNGRLKFIYKQSGSWYGPIVIDTPTVVMLQPAPASDLPRFSTAELRKINPRGWQDSQLKLEAIQAALAEDDPPGVGSFTSTAVDSAGRIHISYYDGNRQCLKYARWDGFNPWLVQTVDCPPSDVGGWGKYTSIDTDSLNYAHISYMDEKYDGLRYAFDSASGWSVWTIEDVKNDQLVGPFTSLVLDANDLPHISYLDFGDYNGGYYTPQSHLRYATEKNNVIVPTTIDSGGKVGWYTSIALDSGNLPVISYYDVTNGDLKFAGRAGKGWNYFTVENNGNTGLYTSIAFFGTSTVGISYFRADTGELKFTTWNGSTSSTSVVNQSGDLGLSTSLDMNRLDVPYIGYFNDSNDSLKMAFYTPPLWLRQVIYNTTSAGNYNSLKLDKYGEPAIAFYDIQNADLVYAYWRVNKWYFVTVDSVGDVGQYVSLAFDNVGRGSPHISYYDATNGYLKYAYYVGTGGNCGASNDWKCEIRDSTDFAGLYTSIALDSTNRPTISYYAYQEYGCSADICTDGELRRVFKSPIDAWVKETIDGKIDLTSITPDVGRFSSIALDPTNGPYISYYNTTNGDLKLAVYAGGGGNCGLSNGIYFWNCMTVDGAAPIEDVGQYTSLKIDSTDKLHISYYDVTHGDLKYAACIGAVCIPQSVDAAGNVGLFTSLALTQAGLPAISYYDYTNGDLKYASMATLPTSPTSIYTLLPYVRKQ